jgi:ribosomal protein S18 acetylase RimI-like enzyme
LIAHLVEHVQNLHAQFLPTIYKPFEYNEIQKVMDVMLSNEMNRVFVAKLNDEIIGYILIVIKNIPESAFYFTHQIIHIDQLSVSEKYKRNGVGAILMDKAEKLAKELNINRMELDYLEFNLNAKSFFHNKGFLPYRGKMVKHLG